MAPCRKINGWHRCGTYRGMNRACLALGWHLMAVHSELFVMSCMRMVPPSTFPKLKTQPRRGCATRCSLTPPCRLPWWLRLGRAMCSTCPACGEGAACLGQACFACACLSHARTTSPAVRNVWRSKHKAWVPSLHSSYDMSRCVYAPFVLATYTWHLIPVMAVMLWHKRPRCQVPLCRAARPPGSGRLGGGGQLLVRHALRGGLRALEGARVLGLVAGLAAGLQGGTSAALACYIQMLTACHMSTCVFT